MIILQATIQFAALREGERQRRWNRCDAFPNIFYEPNALGAIQFQNVCKRNFAHGFEFTIRGNIHKRFVPLTAIFLDRS